MMAQKNLANMLEHNFNNIEIIGMTSSVKETLEWLSNPNHNPDVIFLDVELSDGEGFDILRQADIKAKVIMTTAYDNYAIKAFEAGTLDYLLKPIEIDALKRAVKRAEKSTDPTDIKEILSKIVNPGKTYREKIIVRLNNMIIPLQVRNIAYIYSEDKNNYIVTFDNSHYIIDSTLDEIAEDLDPDRFFKISRSCIVAIDAINSIVRQIGSRLKIISNPESKFDMTVSRSRVDDFLAWLEK